MSGPQIRGWAIEQCTGKAAFNTFTQANAAAKRKGPKSERIGPRRAYRCPFCHHWHLGAAKDRERRLRELTD